MLIFFYVIDHIIIYKNIFLHKLIYTLFAPYRKCICIHIKMIPKFYIYYLRIYKINLRFIFYKSVQAQC
jgi:hypothetical protein